MPNWKFLGTEKIVQRQRRISFAPGRCGVDLLHLDARLRAAHAELDRAGGPAPERLRADAEAIPALYRGPLLPDVDAAWAAETEPRISASASPASIVAWAANETRSGSRTAIRTMARTSTASGSRNEFRSNPVP